MLVASMTKIIYYLAHLDFIYAKDQQTIILHSYVWACTQG